MDETTTKGAATRERDDPFARLTPDERRRLRICHGAAFLAPVVAAALTVGVAEALHVARVWLGTPPLRAAAEWSMTGHIVFGTCGSAAAAFWLHPLPNHRRSAALTWLFASPVVYFVAMFPLAVLAAILT